MFSNLAAFFRKIISLFKPNVPPISLNADINGQSSRIFTFSADKPSVFTTRSSVIDGIDSCWTVNSPSGTVSTTSESSFGRGGFGRGPFGG